MLRRGDRVEIVRGAFRGQVAAVDALDPEKDRLRVWVVASERKLPAYVRGGDVRPCGPAEESPFGGADAPRTASATAVPPV